MFSIKFVFLLLVAVLSSTQLSASACNDSIKAKVSPTKPIKTSVSLDALQVRALVSTMNQIYRSTEELVGDLSIEDEDTVIYALKELKLLVGVMENYVTATKSSVQLNQIAKAYTPWATDDKNLLPEALASLNFVFNQKTIHEISQNSMLLSDIEGTIQSILQNQIESKPTSAEFGGLVLSFPEASTFLTNVSIIGVSNIMTQMMEAQLSSSQVLTTNFISKTAFLISSLSYIQSKKSESVDLPYAKLLSELSPYRYALSLMAIDSNNQHSKALKALSEALKQENVQKFLRVFFVVGEIDQSAASLSFISSSSSLLNNCFIFIFGLYSDIIVKMESSN